MEFAQPPPDVSQVNFNMPPPQARHPNQHGNNLVLGGGGGGHHHHYHHHFGGGMGAGKPGHPYFKQFGNFGRGPNGLPMTQDDFDGKRLRKSVMRKTVDYNASIVRALENRVWQRDFRDRHALQPESIYVPDLMPPPSYLDNPSNAVTTKFVKTATNKMRCPIFTLAWTPEGRRLVTGASSGEFTLWNGLTFNFETILQAHDVPVRTMVWSHNDIWMVTGDHSGCVKYWQSNMNNVKMFQAHKEPIRGISFSPSDNKFVSCSDDGTLRVWDFYRCQEERVLRGHGADVKCVHWHPQKALIVSGSKDNQQPIKLWDPKSGQALATLHAHKSTVMDLKWNDNGNWLVTASRDHLLKLFDLRNLREEVQVFRGHKKEASAVSWHPVHEGLFCSGGSDGSILFWNVGTDKEVGAIDQAHDSIVWTLAWHPLGHILCSGSNDHTIKFWTRNRPGDQMRDKYNLNTLPASWAGMDECDIEEHHIIPGMGPEDKVDFTESLTADKGFIPGLDLDQKNIDDKRDKEKKVPFSKPIPRNFQAQWNDTGRTDDAEEATSKEIKEVITQIVEKAPAAVPLQKIAPSAIYVYGKVVQVDPGSKLEAAILAGPDALNKYISSGEIKELADVLPFNDSPSPTPSGRSSPSERSRSPIRRKKSRFDTVQEHNAQMIYAKDVDARQQIQPRQAPSVQSTFIPPLLALNVSQPDEFPNASPVPTKDQDYRNYPTNDFNSSCENMHLSPWAEAPPIIQQSNASFIGSAAGGEVQNVINNAPSNMPFNTSQTTNNNFSNFNNSFPPPFDGPFNNNKSNNGVPFSNNGPPSFSGGGNGPTGAGYASNKDGNNRDNWSQNTRNNDARLSDNFNRNEGRNNRDSGRRNDRNRPNNRSRNRGRF